MKKEYWVSLAAREAGLYLKSEHDRNFTQQMYHLGYMHGVEAASDYDRDVWYIVNYVVWYNLKLVSIEPDFRLNS